jgi:hypothetical protein
MDLILGSVTLKLHATAMPLLNPELEHRGHLSAILTAAEC